MANPPIELACGCSVMYTCCIPNDGLHNGACYPDHYAAGLWKVYPSYSLEKSGDCRIPYHHKSVTEFYLKPTEEELSLFKEMGIEEVSRNRILYKVAFSSSAEMIEFENGEIQYRNMLCASHGSIRKNGKLLTFSGPSRVDYAPDSHDGFGVLDPECWDDEDSREDDEYYDDEGFCHCSPECAEQARIDGCECNDCEEEEERQQIAASVKVIQETVKAPA